MIAVFAAVLLFTATHKPLAIPSFDIAAECESAISIPNCQETEHTSLGAVRYWWPRVRSGTAQAGLYQVGQRCSNHALHPLDALYRRDFPTFRTRNSHLSMAILDCQ